MAQSELDTDQWFGCEEGFALETNFHRLVSLNCELSATESTATPVEIRTSQAVRYVPRRCKRRTCARGSQSNCENDPIDLTLEKVKPKMRRRTTSSVVLALAVAMAAATPDTDTNGVPFASDDADGSCGTGEVDASGGGGGCGCGAVKREEVSETENSHFLACGWTTPPSTSRLSCSPRLKLLVCVLSFSFTTYLMRSGSYTFDSSPAKPSVDTLRR